MSEAGTGASPTGADRADGADAIVVAAGASSRMGGPDKLEQRIGDRPLLAHTLAALAASESVSSIIVVAGADRRDAITQAPWLPASVRAVVLGGRSRQESVRSGFEALEDAVPDPSGGRVTLVHDGARPVVSIGLVERVIAATREFGAAIPVLPAAETIKQTSDGLVTATVDRTGLGFAQTPQGIRRTILRDALASPLAAGGTWTDEAALLEACKIPVHVVLGEPSNIKVTTPADLHIVTALLERPGPDRDRRTGIGQDAHAFGPGEPLMLGGVAFAGVPRLHGHSDGDVVLHAVADALLGAAGLGDLGRLFPAGPSTPKDIAGRKLLGEVLGRLATAGWRPAAIDLTIVAARPRLGSRLDAMRDSIASILGVDAAAVDVKASTGNLEGPEGAGRSISALALATIEATR